MTAPSRILVVDDNEVNRTVAADLLQHSGHRVATAEDGSAAIIAVRDGGPFDLVLLDMCMPGMDGIEAAEAIRALPGPAGAVPIILLTATLVAEDEPRWRRAGILGCLVKPFRPDHLAAFLTKPAAVPAAESGPALVAASDLALDLAALGRERMVGLAELFRRSSGGDLAQLPVLLGQGKLAEAGAVAHRMAGAAASLHLHPLSALCREIESAARAQNHTLAAERITAASGLWPRSLEALMQALGEGA